MSSPWKTQPEVAAQKIMKRVAVSQMARKLQNRLALAQFKTNRGWEDLSLDTIEPKVEEEQRRRRPMSSGDILSDSSSSSTTSEFQYTTQRTLMSSPLKSLTFFSDQIESSGSSNGHRKRMYLNSFEAPSSSSGSRKRFRSSPNPGRTTNFTRTAWKEQRGLAQSSPIRPRKHTHFTTSTGPDLSFYGGSNDIQPTNFTAPSDDEDDTLPAHSFNIQSSPPRTPPPIRDRGSLGRRHKDKNGKSEEGADLLLFLATSPSPANPAVRARMQPPSTPPQKNMALPSSMMTTPGGGAGLLSGFGNPQTPGQHFDFSDFVNITPSPGQRAWPQTPGAKTPGTVKTPHTLARRHLNYDVFSSSPRDNGSTKHTGLGMQLGGDFIS